MERLCGHSRQLYCKFQQGCWSHHVALDGLPTSPARGTKKRKVRECVEVESI